MGRCGAAAQGLSAGGALILSAPYLIHRPEGQLRGCRQVWGCSPLVGTGSVLGELRHRGALLLPHSAPYLICVPWGSCGSAAPSTREFLGAGRAAQLRACSLPVPPAGSGCAPGAVPCGRNGALRSGPGSPLIPSPGTWGLSSPQRYLRFTPTERALHPISPPPPFIPTGVVLYFLQTRGYPPVPGENSPHGTSRPLLREAEAGRTPQRGRTNGRPSPTPQLLLTNKQHAGRGERMGGKAISSPIGSIVRPSSLPRLSRRDPLFLLVCPHVTPVDPQATPPAPPPPRLQPLRAVCKGKTAVKRAAGRGQRGGQQAARRLAAAGRSNQYGALRLARGRRGRPGSLLALGRVLSGGS